MDLETVVEGAKYAARFKHGIITLQGVCSMMRYGQVCRSLSSSCLLALRREVLKLCSSPLGRSAYSHTLSSFYPCHSHTQHLFPLTSTLATHHGYSSAYVAPSGIISDSRHYHRPEAAKSRTASAEFVNVIRPTPVRGVGVSLDSPISMFKDKLTDAMRPRSQTAMRRTTTRVLVLREGTPRNAVHLRPRVSSSSMLSSFI